MGEEVEYYLAQFSYINSSIGLVSRLPYIFCTVFVLRNECVREINTVDQERTILDSFYLLVWLRKGKSSSHTINF